ncbi:ionotropic receptor 21a-like [Chironomus tepperi]|uniref:ionotropic receptor 21a-like n=1 Tax=Chironomus tepperi TaxID=113505 RepID=UPI00391EE988
MAPCVLRLCEKYFKSERALTGSLVIINLVSNPSVVQARILQNFNEDTGHNIAVMVKDSKKPHRSSRVQEKAQNYFMLIQHFDDFEATLNQLRSLPTWNPLAQFVVQFTIPFEDEKLQAEWIERLFTELLSNDVLKVNAMYQFKNDTERIGVITWFPYHNVSCPVAVENILKIEDCYVVTSINETTEQQQKNYKIESFNQDLYPLIPKKLHRCRMDVSAVVWEPFVVASENDYDDDDVIEKGLEVLMLKTITDGMDMNLTFQSINNERASRTITDNNRTGFYSSILRRRADVMIGGLSENQISRKLLSASIPYYQDDITWCVAKAGLQPKWLNVFIIFNYKTWIALISTLFITSAVLYIFVRIEGKYRENYAWAFLIMFSVSTGQYAHYQPIRIGLKIFFIGFFFFGLHISTAYHSYLINVLTNPRYLAQIESLTDAMKINMTFKAAENAREFFQKNDSTSQYLLKNYVICKKLDDCFMDIVKDKSQAVAISRSHALNNPLQLKDSIDFSCFPVQENVVIYSVVMLFRKFHHLLPMINEKIRTIAESGLLSKWEMDSVKTSKEQDTSSGGGHGSTQIKLALEHVEGAFILVIIGLLLSLAVFVAEYYIHWIVKSNKHVKLKKIIEDRLCQTECHKKLKFCKNK